MTDALNWVNQYPYDDGEARMGKIVRVVRVDTDKKQLFSLGKKARKKFFENMSIEELTVVAIQENRFPDVINHLRHNFFADEPLNKAVGLCQPGDSHYELEQHCLQTLKQGYSRMMIDNKGTIAGTVLNGIVQRGEREEAERRLAEMSDKKFQTIFGLLYKVNEKIDLFTKYNVDDLFECRILSVDDRFRGRGLANALVQESLETAKNAGFKHALQIKYAWDFRYAKIFKADATGLFSQKVFLKYGFKTEAEIPYSDIGVSIRPAPPHQALKLMVKILE